MRKATIDLSEEAEQLREEVAEIEEAKDQLLAEINEEYESFREVPKEDEDAFDSLEEERIDILGTARALENAVEEWGGSEIVIRELDTGAIGEIRDRVSEESFDFDPQRQEMVGGTPKEGYGMVETLRKSIVSQPPDAPTYRAGGSRNSPGDEAPAPGEYPHQVGMFIFEKVNNFNAVGDTDLGNSSLREEMKS